MLLFNFPFGEVKQRLERGVGTVFVRTSIFVVQEGKIETFLSWTAKVERGGLKRTLMSGPRAQSMEEPRSFSLGGN